MNPNGAKYLSMFDRLFRNENRMSSTYKPVFMRAMLDVGDMENKDLIGRQWLKKEGEKLLVDLNFVAARFSKYYWDMEYGFRLRQSQDPKDANILRLIKSERKDGQKPPTLEKLAGDDMADFRKNVIKESIRKEVLVHLLTDMDGLYKKIDANTLEFDLDIVDFLGSHRTILRKGLNNMIVKYLEKMNGATPKIAAKVDCELTYRHQLRTEMKLKLKNHQDCKCFYCTRKFTKYDVDHVIPHNYVFTTDVYNCVLACKLCNCEKSDRLPDKDTFGQVLERNCEIENYMKEMSVIYSDKAYSQMFENCMQEYNGYENFFVPEQSS